MIKKEGMAGYIVVDTNGKDFEVTHFIAMAFLNDFHSPIIKGDAVGIKDITISKDSNSRFHVFFNIPGMIFMSMRSNASSNSGHIEV